ncbi:MAG: pafC [Ilumatobacteraceae bacterium]|nr:pafC [Ilumatobacteraceae bacterium]
MTTRRGPRPAPERLKRLLVMLPWLMERGEVSITEMAEHFSLTTSEVVADLELASMCGLPPFVDELIDVFIDDGMVFTGVPRVFTRPLRLTAPEGFALLIAGRAAMVLPGADPSGPLGRALDKLAAVLGDDGVVVEFARPPLADDVAAAAEAGERMVITYWTPSRDEAADREITPRAVFADRGHWYVLADDHRTESERSFRIDRILAARPTGAVDPPREVSLPDTDRWFAVDADIERVTLRMPTELTWMIERYPVDSLVADPRSKGAKRTSTSAPPSTSTAVMPVLSEQWLERLLLRLGPGTVVVSPERWSSLAGRAAADVLAAYRSVSLES